MKTGRYLMNCIVNDSFHNAENAIANLGDNIQALAIDSIYEQINICPDDIRYIERDFASMYNDDEIDLILYTEFAKSNISKRMTMSSKINLQGVISAVFYDDFSTLNSEYSMCQSVLKSLEPIGARDEKTRNYLRDNGIESYLTGCFTLCFPRRVATPSKSKVFLIDIPQELESFIPEAIKQNGEKITHAIPIREYPISKNESLRLDDEARKLLDRYKNEATLVVTGRLHAALPCIAMGIPVILACKNMDFRFEWVEKLIRPYQQGEYHLIDWSPSSIDIEDVKNKMLAYFKKTLSGKSAIEEMKWLDNYYMDRTKVKSHLLFRRQLSQLKNVFKDKSFNYMIWGAGYHCGYLLELMQEMFPNAIPVFIVDKYRTGKLNDIPIIRQSEISTENIDYLFITTVPGSVEALEWHDVHARHIPYMLITSQHRS